MEHIDGLVQERRNSSALAMELRLSWTNPVCMNIFRISYQFLAWRSGWNPSSWKTRTWLSHMVNTLAVDIYTPAQQSWRGDILDSPCPSIRPSVCRRHGFRSISQVSCEISISNFICMLTVAIGRSLSIFSDVTFKMAAWRPYWIFWFLDSNFTLALNINFKHQRHNTYVYG